jgi:hypothetical protein
MDPITLGIAGLSAGLGAFMSSRENKKQRRMLDAMANENRNRYYESTYLNDIAKNAPLRRVQEQNDKMNRGINSSAISGGLTNENRLAQMETAGNIYAGAVNDLTAQQAQRQMAIKQNYEDKEDQINAARQQLNAARGQMWANLGSNLAGSAIDLGIANEWMKKRPASGGTVAGGNSGYMPLSNAEKNILGITNPFSNKG